MRNELMVRAPSTNGSVYSETLLPQVVNEEAGRNSRWFRCRCRVHDNEQEQRFRANYDFRSVLIGLWAVSSVLAAAMIGVPMATCSLPASAVGLVVVCIGVPMATWLTHKLCHRVRCSRLWTKLVLAPLPKRC